MMTLMRFRGLVLSAIAAAASACGGSPVQPSPTSHQSSVLNIAGDTTLSVGMTSQLTARFLDGSTATGVTWTSATPTVVTVSSDGLLTALADGASAITASVSSVDGRVSSKGTVSVLVQPPSSSTNVLTACASITSPGRYVVDRDMPLTSPCFTISNMADVQLDCQGHRMRAIVLNQVSHASIANCTVAANIQITNSDDVTVSGSTIIAGFLAATRSTNVVFSGNTLNPGSGLTAPVILNGGSNNKALHNTMEGGYNGGTAEVGTDDGIIIDNEIGDVIEGNTIRNFFDAGIEGVGSVTDTRIANNTMTNIGVAGVSSYWCTAWTNTTVQGNNVGTAPRMIWLFYATGPKCGGSIAPAAFSDNQFVGNRFHDLAPGRYINGIKHPAIEITMPGIVQRNMIQGNDVGIAPSPFLTPLEGFIDGGGNLCGPFDALLSNFICRAP